MKTLNLFSHVWRLMILVLSTLLISLTGCTKQGPDPTGLSDELNDTKLKSFVAHEGTVNLQGYMRWYVYAKKEHKLIVDPTMMYTMCTAELTFTGDQNFILNTTEIVDMGYGPFLFRQISFRGMMSPGGELKFTWPETWLEFNGSPDLQPAPYPNLVAQVRAHTGYELSGPGVNNGTLNYNGFFDGTKFFADCHANAFQMEPGIMGAPYDVVVDGPIIFSMITELVVVD
jgi:hypothetical protein